MPTAAKLVSAFLFGLVALAAAIAVQASLPEAMAVGRLVLISTLIGVLTGWFVMGGLVGRGLLASAGHGLRTSATLLFWVLLAVAIIEMLNRSLRKLYGDAMEAVISVLELMLEFLGMAATTPVILILVAGGAAAGIAAELVNRRWP